MMDTVIDISTNPTNEQKQIDKDVIYDRIIRIINGEDISLFLYCNKNEYRKISISEAHASMNSFDQNI